MSPSGIRPVPGSASSGRAADRGQFKLREAEDVRGPVHLPHLPVDLVDAVVIRQKHVHLAGAVSPSAASAVRMVRRIRAQLASLAAPGTSAVMGM